MTVAHPAKFSTNHIAAIQDQLDNHCYGLRPQARLLDPFAGTGGIHRLTGYRTEGIELEREWADQHPLTQVGNVLDLPYRRGTFSVIATSPCFANRMADHHDAKDESERHTYKHTLGRDLSIDSAAILTWGPQYQIFHTLAIAEFTRVTKKSTEDHPTWCLLNMSDHIRRWQVEPVTAWWIEAMTRQGWQWVGCVAVPTVRQRKGSNAAARVDTEWLLRFRRMT